MGANGWNVCSDAAYSPSKGYIATPRDVGIHLPQNLKHDLSGFSTSSARKTVVTTQISNSRGKTSDVPNIDPTAYCTMPNLTSYNRSIENLQLENSDYFQCKSPSVIAQKAVVSSGVKRTRATRNPCDQSQAFKRRKNKLLKYGSSRDEMQKEAALPWSSGSEISGRGSPQTEYQNKMFREQQNEIRTDLNQGGYSTGFNSLVSSQHLNGYHLPPMNNCNVMAPQLPREMTQQEAILEACRQLQYQQARNQGWNHEPSLMSNPGVIPSSNYVQQSHFVVPPNGQTIAGQNPMPLNFPGLPFPLPAVPPGFRLVITHRPLPSQESPAQHQQQVTQLIIDHPSYTSPPPPSPLPPPPPLIALVSADLLSEVSTTPVTPSPPRDIVNAIRPKTLHLHSVLTPDIVQCSQNYSVTPYDALTSHATPTPVSLTADRSAVASKPSPGMRFDDEGIVEDAVVVIQPISCSSTEDILEKSMREADVMQSCDPQSSTASSYYQHQPCLKFASPSDRFNAGGYKSTAFMNKQSPCTVNRPTVFPPASPVDRRGVNPADQGTVLEDGYYRPKAQRNNEFNKQLITTSGSLSSTCSEQGAPNGWPINEMELFPPNNSSHVTYSSPDGDNSQVSSYLFECLYFVLMFIF